VLNHYTGSGAHYTGNGQRARSAAESYDGPRRRLIPGFDDFYGIAFYGITFYGIAFYGIAAALAASVQPARVLDLGAGTGILAGHVAALAPGARLTLLDAGWK
jgi:tRNA (cmo5U34)-methyltransferase